MIILELGVSGGFFFCKLIGVVGNLLFWLADDLWSLVPVDVLTSLILDISITKVSGIVVGTCMSDFVMLLGSVVVEFIFLVESRHVILNVPCLSRICSLFLFVDAKSG